MSTCLLYCLNFFKKNDLSGLAFEEYDITISLSAYFLKGVVPEWDLKDIYLGMMQFMVLQIIGLILIIVFPKIALWLPTLLYGQ